MAKKKPSKKQRDKDAVVKYGKPLHATCQKCGAESFRLSVKSHKWTRHCNGCGQKLDLDTMEELPDEEQSTETVGSGQEKAT